MVDHNYRVCAHRALWAYIFVLGIDQIRPQSMSSIEFWCVDLILNFLIPCLLIWKFRLLEFAGRDQFGISRFRWEDIGLWIFVALCFVFANLSGALIGRGISSVLPGMPAYDPYYFRYLPSETVLRILAVTYLSSTAAFFEELFFRGMAYVVWMQEPEKRQSFYIFFAVFLFAIIHWRNGAQGVFATLFIGALAAMIFAKTRDLKSVVVGHFVVNWWAQW